MPNRSALVNGIPPYRNLTEKKKHSGAVSNARRSLNRIDTPALPIVVYLLSRMCVAGLRIVLVRVVGVTARVGAFSTLQPYWTESLLSVIAKTQIVFTILTRLQLASYKRFARSVVVFRLPR